MNKKVLFLSINNVLIVVGTIALLTYIGLGFLGMIFGYILGLIWPVAMYTEINEKLYESLIRDNNKE